MEDLSPLKKLRTEQENPEVQTPYLRQVEFMKSKIVEACQNGDLPKIQRIVTAYPEYRFCSFIMDQNDPVMPLGTPLMVAAKHGQIEVMKFLIDYHRTSATSTVVIAPCTTDIDHLNGKGCTAFYIWCNEVPEISKEVDEDIVRLFIEQGAAVPSVSCEEGKTVLHVAASKARVNLVRAIVEVYRQQQVVGLGDERTFFEFVNQKRQIGGSALSIAAAAGIEYHTGDHGDLDVSDELLAKYDEIVTFLVPLAGPYMNVILTNDLAYAAEHDLFPILVQGTPIYAAVVAGRGNNPPSIEIVKLLLQHGADPYFGNNVVLTATKKPCTKEPYPMQCPIYKALETFYSEDVAIEMIEHLLTTDRDRLERPIRLPVHSGSWGDDDVALPPPPEFALSLLHIACRFNRFKVVKRLVDIHDFDFDVDVPDEVAGWTPLHFCISNLRPTSTHKYIIDTNNDVVEIIKLLFSAGADLNTGPATRCNFFEMVDVDDDEDDDAAAESSTFNFTPLQLLMRLDNPEIVARVIKLFDDATCV